MAKSKLKSIFHAGNIRSAFALTGKKRKKSSIKL
jgi:hypothetical protein